MSRSVRNVLLSLTCILGLFTLVQAQISTTAKAARNDAQAPSDPRQGWTQSPNSRGTLDIIWDSAFTLFLCCWSVLCLNVPGPNDTDATTMRRRVVLAFFAAIGPEFVFAAAVGQFFEARRSVKQFHASGYTSWTLRRAFYVNSGGLMLKFGDFKHFPIDAKQLHYLVTKGYIDFPAIDEGKIRDRNKSDGLLRILTLLQTVWFLVNVIVRAAQGLAVTTLELTTSSFILVAVGITVFAFRKPDSIREPELLSTEQTIAGILSMEKTHIGAIYQRTPLDFISRREYSLSQYWAHWTGVLRSLGLNTVQRHRPVTRIANANNLAFYGIRGPPYWLLIVMSTAYFGIFIAGWNFSFPTRIESTLWRAASILPMAGMWVFSIVTELAFLDCVPPYGADGEPRQQGGLAKPSPDVEKQQGASEGLTPKRKQNRLQRLLHRAVSRIRNNSVAKDPELELPSIVIVLIDLCGVAYFVGRLYIWVEDFVELRSLPPSAYQTVDWSWAIPHI